ncbi:MAG TPA: peptide chain release factor N(5)-glutamine methyltransferase [Nitrospira sp.]|jgi:release factor glutamine methyltransferase|nr:peptide chain release factor N(5)-glutamine methyltransferase [Nitrospira sp.]
MSGQVLEIADPSRFSVGALLASAECMLKEAGIEQPALEAGWLLEHVLELSPLLQRVRQEHHVTADDRKRVQTLVTRRANREPLQYVLGTQEFCGREFYVTSAVLIPRPESALLVEETVRRCRLTPSATVVDVGTGSGCLAVSIAAALPTAHMLAIDVSSNALSVARENMLRHGVAERITGLCGDLLSPLETILPRTRVDVILSNPPYIEEMNWMALQPEVRCFEPRLALAGGRDGMDLHRRLIQRAPQFLKPNGVLLMEVGMGQAMSVCRYAEASGSFRVYEVLRDEGGIDRVVCLEYKNRGKQAHNALAMVQMKQFTPAS